MTSPHDEDEVARVAALLDEIAIEQSRYRRSLRSRELLLEPHQSNELVDGDQEDPFEDPDDRIGRRLPLTVKAAWWAMRFHLQIEGDPGKERATMEPEFEGPDGAEPPHVTDIPNELISVWEQFAELVETPAAGATLRHLLFQARAGNVPENARLAVDAYCKLATSEGRHFDAVFAARAAVRLARAVKDAQRRQVALMTLIEATRHAMSGPSQSFGAAMRGLETLIGENSPNGTRELLEQAVATWPVGQQADQVLGLVLSATTDAAAREKIWAERVENFLTMAENADSNIMRAMRLRQAVETAERSGFRSLQDRPTRLLQEVRHLDLEMMRIHASSRRFQEQWEETIAVILGDASSADQIRASGDSEEPDGESAADETQPKWALRLRAFGNFDSPTGDPDSNREIVRQRRAGAPLQALLPTRLQTPEGLPLYAPSNEQEHFELDMVRWETDLLEQWVYLFSDALQRVAEDGGPPPGAEIEKFFHVGPAVTANEAGSFSRALERYWSGDTEAAAFTAFPLVEALLRNALLAADQGIYRLQKKQSPGQYVGIGSLLELFADAYDISERDRRFFNALLNHPGGWNVRNLMAHGYILRGGAPLAAVLIFAAMKIVLLALRNNAN